MKIIPLALPLFALLSCAIAPLAVAASPKAEVQKCYYTDPISKAAYDKAIATLQRNPNELESLICAGLYQADSLKQGANALKTLKRAEQVSLKSEERELNLIQRHLVTVSGNLPATGSYADDQNYYRTVRDRADKQNETAFKQCWDAYAKQNFDAAINAASASVWRNSKLSEGNHCLGRAYRDKGEYAKALIHFHRLELMWDGIDNGQPFAQSALSSLYNSLGQSDLALDYGNKALNEWRRLGNKKNEATLLNNIALIYNNQGDKRRAITYYEQALALKDNDADKASTWNNLASIYAAEGDYPKAIATQQKALAAYRSAGNRLNTAITQLNLGNTYRHAKDYPQSEQQLLEGLKAVQQLGAKNWEITAYQYLAWLREDQGKMDEYLDYLRKGLALAQATGNQANIKALGDELKAAGK